jgi:hypothetical protein
MTIAAHLNPNWPPTSTPSPKGLILGVPGYNRVGNV